MQGAFYVGCCPSIGLCNVCMDYEREKMGKRSQECRKDTSRVALCLCHTLFGMNLRPFG